MARGTGVIPFPYPEGAAAEWIDRELTSLPKGDGSAYVLTLKDTGEVMGNISVHESEGERKAVIGYIVGRPFKGQGYASEALQRVVRWYFESTAHLRLFATCFSFNAASARILEKAGFHREGLMRQDYCPDGRVEDVFIYGLLRSDWEQRDNAIH